MSQDKQRISQVSADVKRRIIRSFKIIVVGDQSVGKTCLTFRFCDNKFVQPATTVGLELREKTVVVDNETIKLVIWDTAGQERFRRTMVSHYYRNVDAIVLVYDMTKIETFKSLHFWLDECKEHGISTNEIPCILVGNKCDCTDDGAVSHAMGMRFADRFGMPFFETSAFSDDEYENVNSIFMTLAYKLKNRKTFGLPSESSVFKLDASNENQEDGLTSNQSGSACC